MYQPVLSGAPAAFHSVSVRYLSPSLLFRTKGDMVFAMRSNACIGSVALATFAGSPGGMM